MSVNCGIGRPLHFFALAPGGGGGGSGCPLGAWPIMFPGTTDRTANKSKLGHHIVAFLPISTTIAGGRFTDESTNDIWSLQHTAKMLKRFRELVVYMDIVLLARPERVISPLAIAIEPHSIDSALSRIIGRKLSREYSLGPSNGSVQVRQPRGRFAAQRQSLWSVSNLRVLQIVGKLKPSDLQN